jgi:hypothetical protein
LKEHPLNGTSYQVQMTQSGDGVFAIHLFAEKGFADYQYSGEGAGLLNFGSCSMCLIFLNAS